MEKSLLEEVLESMTVEKLRKFAQGAKKKDLIINLSNKIKVEILGNKASEQEDERKRKLPKIAEERKETKDLSTREDTVKPVPKGEQNQIYPAVNGEEDDMITEADFLRP